MHHSKSSLCIHPASEVSQPDQLVGREKESLLFRNALERHGNNIFVWGRRGVGKTSLARTSINAFSDVVYIGPSVACEGDTTKEALFADIVRRASPNSRTASKTKISIKTPIGSYERDYDKAENQVGSINQATEILSATFPQKYNPPRHAAIIIDEFDQLKNSETKSFLTALAKQMSVDDTPVKLIFCGVSEDLETLIGHHESVGRYITAIKVNSLSDDHIWKIADNIGSQFGIKTNRGQQVRIGQIACGFPTFAHLIMEEILNVIYEQRISDQRVSQEVFNEAMRRAASGAATHLQGAYTNATQKGTDRYIEVLWAAASGPHITNRQFKDIFSTYRQIMSHRDARDPINKETLFRNHLNSLCKPSHGEALKREKSGWYSFSDPMFRGYVRMMAYNEGVELGDESFPA